MSIFRILFLISLLICVGKSDDHTDFIVVGSGPAGCVLSRSLYDAGFSVLLLESGPNLDSDPLIKSAAAAPNLIVNQYENYFLQESSFQQGLNGRVLRHTQGRLFGGTSSVNGQYWVRGTKELFTKWENAINDSSWSFDKILNIFIDLEDYSGISQNISTRGDKGKLSVRQTSEPSTNPAVQHILQGFQAAAAASGISVPVVIDYNTEPSSSPDVSACIFAEAQVTQKFGVNQGDRESASQAFLSDILEFNADNFSASTADKKLTVLFKATVLDILLENNNRARGVRVLQKGKIHKKYADKELVISAGISTPSILQRSGIGPINVLNNAGVDVKIEAPYVGQNLVEHVLFFAAFTNTNNESSSDPFSSRMGGAFLPDPRSTADKTIRSIQFSANLSPTGLSLLGFELRPLSKGTVNIQDNDPLRVPLPTSQMLTNPDDLNLLIAVYQTYVQAFATAVAPFGYTLLSPTFQQIADTSLLTSFIKANAGDSYHWTSSVRMATIDNQGAVDGSGRLYGAKNLIIADDTICPIINGGNTQSTSYLIGRKISLDLIKKYKP